MLYPHREATEAILRRAPVVPVLTVQSAKDALAQARALLAGGLPVLEITLRTPAALSAVSELARTFPDATIGAGTILDPDQIAAAASAGAAFLVSPGMTEGLIEAAVRSPIPFLPGAATVSEALTLRARGFCALKFFPAEAAGGTRFLASLAGPVPDLLFCPTGGIDAQKAGAYLSLANVACVGGSWMVAPSLLAARDFAKVEELAREASALGRRL
ncbi:MAG TPA: bifunctional 4-hydroxy-2-oxoglutarate aldolase/2-dehydro-3-deoxy-phosphogluconate aldolase [Methylocella sp.]|nr:bifunctional 4-hydroxy-2-oxoglutarate aldolase/2-dehydro-3-deoxy-phosphogluconate aldolase [Methylocella sp.]